MIGASSVGEADLHALVDNRLESDRRAEVLRRLATSPADRARVEAWQEQNESIRSAFDGIAREAIPRVLDIAPVSSLHGFTDADPLSLEGTRFEQARKGAATLATLLLVAVGVGGSWLLLASSGRNETVASAPMRGTVDEAVALRAAQGFGVDGAQAPEVTEALPTTTIPDLSPAGFTLVGAESNLAAPASLVFRYRNPDAEQIVISVARSQGSASSGPTRVGRTFSWHRRDKVFAIAGTLVPTRLHDIAVALQDNAAQD